VDFGVSLVLTSSHTISSIINVSEEHSAFRAANHEYITFSYRTLRERLMQTKNPKYYLPADS